MNIPTGEFTYEEFYKMVREWRERYAVNGCAVYPPMNQLSFFGNRKVFYYEDSVRLEAI